MDEKEFDALTEDEKADYYKLMATAASADFVKEAPTEEPITEKRAVELGGGFSRPTQIVYENEKEGVRVTEIIEYMHPPDHPGWGAERGRKLLVEKIAVK